MWKSAVVPNSCAVKLILSNLHCRESAFVSFLLATEITEQLTVSCIYLMNQCFWTNQLNKWFNDSLIKTVGNSQLQGCILVRLHTLTSVSSSTIKCLLNLKHPCKLHFTYFIQRILKDASRVSFVSSIYPTIHTKHTHLDSCGMREVHELKIKLICIAHYNSIAVFQFSMTCFIAELIKVIEQIGWVSTSMTHS